MKSLLRSLFGWSAKQPVKPDSDAPLYEYPNDSDASMEQAVGSIWRWYVKLGKQVQICVQGMGGTLEQYHIENAVFKNGVLSWEDSEEPDHMEIHSEEQFRRCFLDWAKHNVINNCRFFDVRPYARPHSHQQTIITSCLKGG